MIDYKLGHLITKGRNKIGISQRELARRTGVDIAEISRIESGIRKKPNVLTLTKIAIILKISSETLMCAAGYTIQEINMYKNNSYGKIFLENNDGSITSVDDILKKERYKTIIYKHILAILNKDEFLDSNHYKSLKKSEQNYMKNIKMNLQIELKKINNISSK